MTTIIEGMTTEEYIAALNENLAGIKVDTHTTITDTMTSIEIQEAINSDLERSDVYIGKSGASYISGFNSIFYTSLADPTNFAVNWVDDFVRITFDDESGGVAQHEIWESKNGGNYTLVKTLDAGVVNYDYQTWQNATLKFRIRSKHGDLKSSFSVESSITTPLIMMVDQSTLTEMAWTYLWVEEGKSVTVDWGDDTTSDFDGHDVLKDTFSKTYATEGQYRITITGDTDYIEYLWPFFDDTLALYYGDLSKWVLPTKLAIMELSTTNIGDISETNIDDWFPLPSSFSTFNLNWTGVYGNMSLAEWNVEMNELYFKDCNLTGNPFTNQLPDPVVGANISIWFSDNSLEGDISTLVLPNRLLLFDISSQQSTNKFYGDCSSVLMPLGDELIPSEYITGISINAEDNNITNGFRGHFSYIKEYNFGGNLFNSTEIDSLLAYIDAYFVDGVVPLCDCDYTLNGTGMGIPSAAGLTSKTSIEGKYTTAEFTATITVNS